MVWTFVHEHGRWKGRSYSPVNGLAVSTDWYSKFEAVVWAIEEDDWN